MPVLNREDFFNRVHDVFSDSTPENIAFIEDMTDTYNDMERRANGDGTDWKQKYEDNDKAWREKYRHRFFSSDGGVYDDVEEEKKQKPDHDPNVSINDLFS